MAIKDYFTKHPASVGETYREHFRVASHFAKDLALASMAAAIHALAPNLFTSTASTKIQQLHSEMTAGLRGETNGDLVREEIVHPQPAG